MWRTAFAITGALSPFSGVEEWTGKTKWAFRLAGTLTADELLTLDADTVLDVGLLIHHITPIQHDARGVRLGCELTHLHGHDRSLQHYIHQTQKRRSALTG